MGQMLVGRWAQYVDKSCDLELSSAASLLFWARSAFHFIICCWDFIVIWLFVLLLVSIRETLDTLWATNFDSPISTLFTSSHRGETLYLVLNELKAISAVNVPNSLPSPNIANFLQNPWALFQHRDSISMLSSNNPSEPGKILPRGASMAQHVIS